MEADNSLIHHTSIDSLHSDLSTGSNFEDATLRQRVDTNFLVKAETSAQNANTFDNVDLLLSSFQNADLDFNKDYVLAIKLESLVSNDASNFETPADKQKFIYIHIQDRLVALNAHFQAQTPEQVTLSKSSTGDYFIVLNIDPSQTENLPDDLASNLDLVELQLTSGQNTITAQPAFLNSNNLAFKIESTDPNLFNATYSSALIFYDDQTINLNKQFIINDANQTLGDTDLDNIPAAQDNCPDDANPDQLDTDQDGQGDACDSDKDNDSVVNGQDNCELIPNTNQTNSDNDPFGDACDDDDDNDTVADTIDNCPLVANGDQVNTDGDANGNACDDDDDNDTILDAQDNCPYTANSNQTDSDNDGVGDACENDIDGDGILDANDNCPQDPNASQADLDNDGTGDSCDDDVDGDTVANDVDNCPLVANTDQADLDNDGTGDSCDEDIDGDTVANAVDNCPQDPNDTQADLDNDGTGDACDDTDDRPADTDQDGVVDALDNCPAKSNPLQEDADFDLIGDACDTETITDLDNDTIPNADDNCIDITNTDQLDTDKDGVGDACDIDSGVVLDRDSDTISDALDNCPNVANTDQEDTDSDGVGDACDIDSGADVSMQVDGGHIRILTPNNVSFKITGSNLSASRGSYRFAARNLATYNIQSIKLNEAKTEATISLGNILPCMTLTCDASTLFFKNDDGDFVTSGFSIEIAKPDFNIGLNSSNQLTGEIACLQAASTHSILATESNGQKTTINLSEQCDGTTVDQKLSFSLDNPFADGQVIFNIETDASQNPQHRTKTVTIEKNTNLSLNLLADKFFSCSNSNSSLPGTKTRCQTNLEVDETISDSIVIFVEGTDFDQARRLVVKQTSSGSILEATGIQVPNATGAQPALMLGIRSDESTAVKTNSFIDVVNLDDIDQDGFDSTNKLDVIIDNKIEIGTRAELEIEVPNNLTLGFLQVSFKGGQRQNRRVKGAIYTLFKKLCPKCRQGHSSKSLRQIYKIH